MIGFLNGTVQQVDAESAIIECHGVGYEVLASLSTLSELVIGAAVKVWIYTHVREDALVLYAFATRAEKEFYLQLLKVNGVGPKMALNIVSGGSTQDIARMIEAEDVKALSKLPKVGKKTAEQIILTLKGKLVASSETLSATGLATRTAGQWQELVSALVNLGFRAPDVEKVVQSLPRDLDFETGFRQALSTLSRV